MADNGRRLVIGCLSQPMDSKRRQVGKGGQNRDPGAAAKTGHERNPRPDLFKLLCRGAHVPRPDPVSSTDISSGIRPPHTHTKRKSIEPTSRRSTTGATEA